MVYCFGKDIYDFTLRDTDDCLMAKSVGVNWHPLPEAKELFKEQHLCREKFADLLKELWEEYNRITGG